MGDHDDIEDNQFPDNDEYVPLVTGGGLPQRNGARVSLWGKVIRVTPGEGFHVRSVDDQEILVKLRRPNNEPLEGWYEIYGVAQGKTILCDEYIPFSADMTKNIDLDGHKGLAKLLAAIDDPWTIEEVQNGIKGVVPME